MPTLNWVNSGTKQKALEKRPDDSVGVMRKKVDKPHCKPELLKTAILRTIQ